MSVNHTLSAGISANLLSWYDKSARVLPWRVSPADRAAGVQPDPYRVWLSEIMLQQTTIPHATRYFLDFVARWPDVTALASAARDDVMNAWAGLGYYSRARNLHACAQIVSERGGFPDNGAELIKLPGVGPYTAGAIASIAFNEPVAAVDGNVERVTSRLLAIDTPLPELKKVVKPVVQDWVPLDRAGDFAQAMMDLGATVCTPRSPDCQVCPLAGACAAREAGNPEIYPVKAKKKDKPVRRGAVLIAHDGDGLIAQRRPDTGLLAGTLGLPTTDWQVVTSALEEAELMLSSDRYIGRVEHVFTHFRLLLDVWESEPARARDLIVVGKEELIGKTALKTAGFPSVFRKALTLWQSASGS